MDDPLIEQFLKSTGLSADDLLQKLQAYKSIKKDEPKTTPDAEIQPEKSGEANKIVENGHEEKTDFNKTDATGENILKAQENDNSYSSSEESFHLTLEFSSDENPSFNISKNDKTTSENIANATENIKNVVSFEDKEISIETKVEAKTRTEKATNKDSGKVKEVYKTKITKKTPEQLDELESENDLTITPYYDENSNSTTSTNISTKSKKSEHKTDLGIELLSKNYNERLIKKTQYNSTHSATLNTCHKLLSRFRSRSVENKVSSTEQASESEVTFNETPLPESDDNSRSCWTPNPIIDELVDEKKCEEDVQSESIIDSEEIRKNLKFQLNFLRNRKKTGKIVEECPEVASFGEIAVDKYTRKHLYKSGTDLLNLEENSFSEKTNDCYVKKNKHSNCEKTNNCKNENSNQFVTETNDFCNEKSNDSHNENTNDSYSSNNETMLKIVSVIGGVSDLDSDDSQQFKPEVKLTKTNDITKIKGWRNKKFAKKNDISDSEHSELKDNSPFVSNSLDEFLQENTLLNIAAPKNNPQASKISQEKIEIKQQLQNDELYSIKKIEAIKPRKIPLKTKKKRRRSKIFTMPKTLKQKRRLLEGFIVKKSTNEIRFKEPKKKLDNNQKHYDTSYDNQNYSRNSYVLYNNVKIRTTRKNNDNTRNCVAKITSKSSIKSEEIKKETKPCVKVEQPKKILLLNSLPKPCPIEYTPGPLGKKHLLQKTEMSTKYETVVKKLPKVYLEVKPEFKKAIPSQIRPYCTLSNAKCNLEASNVEFALTALKNSSSTNVFKFPIPFQHNQTRTYVRRRKILQCKIIQISDERNTIKSIVDDLINYVETKELGDSVLQPPEEYVNANLSQIDSSEKDNLGKISAIVKQCPKKRAQRTKVDIELIRLNCKVVNVKTHEDDSINDETCTKPYCTLGCICKSIKCDSIPRLHCSKTTCMFDCTCPKESLTSYHVKTQEICLPFGTDTLNSNTVDKINDQAKKNLAKVERDFTQTVIHMNNETILVGSRENVRRVSKAPKRFDDFYDHLEHLNLDQKPYKGDKLKAKCVVQLDNIPNLQNLVPFCIIHRCYYCFCNEIFLNSKEAIEVCSDSDADVRETSARTKAIYDTYIVRNRHISYKSKLISKVATYNGETMNYLLCYQKKVPGASGGSNDFESRDLEANNLEQNDLGDDLDVLNAGYEKMNAAKRFKRFLISRSLASNLGNNKRKQSFNVINDNVIEVDKKRPKLSDSRGKLNLGDPKSNHVFSGEIIIPTHENMDLLQKLGIKQTIAQFMRLLPWCELLRNFYTKKINIWTSMWTSNSRLLVNTIEHDPPNGFVCITKAAQRIGIIRWILTKKLPPETPEKLVHLILSPKLNHYEIAGICLKNISQEDVKHVIKSDKSIPNLVACDTKFFKHKNIENNVHVLCLKSCELPKREFYFGENSTQRKRKAEFSLPSLHNFQKYREIYLNSNFAYLRLKLNNYSIKYYDLQNMVSRSKKSSETVALTSLQFRENYSELFSIFMVSEFSDRIFIGPYQNDENLDNIELLRYMNQKLVNIEQFNETTSVNSTRESRWIYPLLKKQNTPPEKNTPQQISLLKKDSTNIQNEPKLNVLDDVEKILSPYRSFNVSDRQENQLINIKYPQFILMNGRKISSENFNVYFMTNIPYLGYLGAQLKKNSKIIDVVWPFGQKVLRFETVQLAQTFIAKRLENLLLPVPATFKISLIMMNSINVEKESPMDVKHLNGTHICGEFGIMDARTLTKESISTVGSTISGIYEKLAKRAQYLASTEITKLKQYEKLALSIKRDLIVKKHTSLTRYMRLLKDLPEEVRHTEYSQFRKEFNNCCLQKDNEVEIVNEKPSFVENKDNKKDLFWACERVIELSSEEEDNASEEATEPPKKKSKLDTMIEEIIVETLSPSNTTGIVKPIVVDMSKNTPLLNLMLQKPILKPLNDFDDKKNAAAQKTCSTSLDKRDVNEILDLTSDSEEIPRGTDEKKIKNTHEEEKNVNKREKVTDNTDIGEKTNVLEDLIKSSQCAILTIKNTLLEKQNFEIEDKKVTTPSEIEIIKLEAAINEQKRMQSIANSVTFKTTIALQNNELQNTCSLLNTSLLQNTSNSQNTSNPQKNSDLQNSSGQNPVDSQNSLPLENTLETNSNVQNSVSSKNTNDVLKKPLENPIIPINATKTCEALDIDDKTLKPNNVEISLQQEVTNQKSIKHYFQNCKKSTPLSDTSTCGAPQNISVDKNSKNDVKSHEGVDSKSEKMELHNSEKITSDKTDLPRKDLKIYRAPFMTYVAKKIPFVVPKQGITSNQTKNAVNTTKNTSNSTKNTCNSTKNTSNPTKNTSNPTKNTSNLKNTSNSTKTASNQTKTISNQAKPISNEINTNVNDLETLSTDSDAMCCTKISLNDLESLEPKTISTEKNDISYDIKTISAEDSKTIPSTELQPTVVNVSSSDLNPSQELNVFSKDLNAFSEDLKESSNDPKTFSEVNTSSTNVEATTTEKTISKDLKIELKSTPVVITKGLKLFQPICTKPYTIASTSNSSAGSKPAVILNGLKLVKNKEGGLQLVKDDKQS